MITYQNRDTLKQLFPYFIHTDIMVEVGSFQGSSALVWAQVFKKIFCVDPWLGVLAKGEKAREGTYETFCERTKDVNAINQLHMTSEEASKVFKDKSVDFVYIDALHDYDSVKQDIKLWLPKIRNGGYIGGHDYGYPPLPDVKKAVDEIFGVPQIIDTEYSWMIKI